MPCEPRVCICMCITKVFCILEVASTIFCLTTFHELIIVKLNVTFHESYKLVCIKQQACKKCSNLHLVWNVVVTLKLFMHSN